MWKFVLRRVAVWVPSVAIILFGIYVIAFYGAGDPIRLMFLRSPGDIAYDPVRIEAIREAAGLSRPVFIQFGDYIFNLLHGNFGNSLITGQPVGRMLAAAAPVSLQLGVATIAVTALIAIPLGILAGTREGSWIDTLILSAALVIWAVPPYVIGPLLLIGLFLLFPDRELAIGWAGLFDARVILPLVVLSLQPVALIVRQTRTVVIDILGENYIRAARARGLPRWLIVARHVSRPALTPIVTQLGLIMITLINGAVFVELVFGLPGLGRLTVAATTDADYPVILGVALLGTMAVMVTNLLVDLAYPLLDPRATGEEIRA
jgi:peptide/nickel transport system permease protein